MSDRRKQSAEIMAIISHGLDVPQTLLVCRAGAKTALSDDERKALIEESRAGKQVELDVQAITYIQKDGEPNRNYVRFKAGRLSKIARSGKNTPFLRDHSQRLQSERGGTVVASASEKFEDGSVVFRQTLRVATPWAVQGVLDGTIDRFSIGWFPTGEIHCTSCKADWRKCAHWPGDQLDDGGVVELEFQDADLVEVSAVNVPAVVGTSITDQIRAALSALATEESNPKPAREREEKAMSTKLLAVALTALGLSENATEEEVAAAGESAKKERSDLAAEKAAIQGERVASAVDAGVAAGRIPAEHREIFQSYGLAHGADALKTKLATLPEGKFGPPRESTVVTTLAPERAPVPTAKPDPTLAAYLAFSGRTIDQVDATTAQNEVLAARVWPNGKGA